jgi:hypothetical protein
VIRRDHLVEAELLKQLPPISILPPHHRRLSPPLKQESLFAGLLKPLSESIGQKRKWRHLNGMSVLSSIVLQNLQK